MRAPPAVERDERASLIVATNVPFGEWIKAFSHARTAMAALTRLTHRAHIIAYGSGSAAALNIRQ